MIVWHECAALYAWRQEEIEELKRRLAADQDDRSVDSHHGKLCNADNSVLVNNCSCCKRMRTGINKSGMQPWTRTTTYKRKSTVSKLLLTVSWMCVCVYGGVCVFHNLQSLSSTPSMQSTRTPVLMAHVLYSGRGEVRRGEGRPSPAAGPGTAGAR
jgi:hypothetical protein